MRGVPLKPGEHSPRSSRHRRGCRPCQLDYNELDRRRQLERGVTRRLYRSRPQQVADGELYGAVLRDAVVAHLRAYPVSGLTALDIARALRMRDPGGGGQVRVRYQLASLAEAGTAVPRREPRADGTRRTCQRWYLAVALPYLRAALWPPTCSGAGSARSGRLPGSAARKPCWPAT